MDQPTDAPATKGSSNFSQQADKSQTGIFAEYLAFLRHNKKWWLVPIVLTLLLVGVLVVLSTTAAAPFIYTLF